MGYPITFFNLTAILTQGHIKEQNETAFKIIISGDLIV